MGIWQRNMLKAVLTFYVYCDRIKTSALCDVETSITLSAPTVDGFTKTGQGQVEKAK